MRKNPADTSQHHRAAHGHRRDRCASVHLAPTGSGHRCARVGVSRPAAAHELFTRALACFRCHRSTVCILHGQHRPRCISHLEVDSYFTSMPAANWTRLRIPQCRRVSPSTLSYDNFCSGSTFDYRMQELFGQGERTEPESTIGRSSVRVVDRIAWRARVVDGGSQVTDGRA